MDGIHQPVRGLDSNVEVGSDWEWVWHEEDTESEEDAESEEDNNSV